MTESGTPGEGDVAEVTSSPELAVASNSWMTRANMPSDRWAPAVASVFNAQGQSVVYAIGGEVSSSAGRTVSTVQAYNASTNAWSTRAPLPSRLGVTNGAAVIGGKIYVSGGYVGESGISSALYVYDPARNTWTSKRAMPRASYGGVSGAINGRLYVLTQCHDGENCPQLFRKILFRYDPTTDQWTALGQAPSEHYLGMAGVIKGKFYVVGNGFQGGAGQLDVYDPGTNTWTTRASMASNRWRGAGTASDGKLYVIGGGITTTSHIPVRTTSVYDPVTNSWTNQRPMPEARTGLAGARLLVNGRARIEVIGGSRPGNNVAYVP